MGGAFRVPKTLRPLCQVKGDKQIPPELGRGLPLSCVPKLLLIPIHPASTTLGLWEHWLGEGEEASTQKSPLWLGVWLAK